MPGRSRPVYGRRGGPQRRRQATLSHAIRKVPLVNGFSAVVVGPFNGFLSNNKRQPVTVIATSQLATSMDVQVEWRAQMATQANPAAPWIPDPTYVANVPSVPSGVPTAIAPPADLQYFTWYYRVRAGNLTNGVWGLWSPQYFYGVQPVIGSTATYLNMNVGIAPATARGDTAYIDMNIGAAAVTSRGDVSSVDLNIGAAVRLFNPSLYADMNIYPAKQQYRTFLYADMNVVTDQTPTPHIWWVRPEQGKEGYVFNIFGHGFGQFQGQFGGKVQLGNLVCSIASWQVVPAALLAGTVTVTGAAKAGSSPLNAYPNILLKAGSFLVEAGDYFEYDTMWSVPSNTRLDIHPHILLNSFVVGAGVGAVGSLNDTTGAPLVSDLPAAYGHWLHRKFVIPSGWGGVGGTVTALGIAWFGQDSAQVGRTGSIRSFVWKRADGTVKAWVTGDDGTANTIPWTYIANGGLLTSTGYDQAGFEIHHGAGLDPDQIDPEHGWIVAVVPPGAVSSNIEVILGS